jgi:cytochrome P450
MRKIFIRASVPSSDLYIVRAASSSNGSSMSLEEAACQIKTVIVAGGETTPSASFTVCTHRPGSAETWSPPLSATLTWALIELCRNFDLQEKVRNEIVSAFPVEDPTYDELVNGLPLLDARVHETLRTHPALQGSLRIVSLPLIPNAYLELIHPDIYYRLVVMMSSRYPNPSSCPVVN